MSFTFFAAAFKCLTADVCYSYEDTPKSWHDAFFECYLQGGSLAVVHSQNVHDFLNEGNFIKG